MTNVILYGVHGHDDLRVPAAMRLAESRTFDSEPELWNTVGVGVWFRKRCRGLRTHQHFARTLAAAATKSLALVSIAGNNLPPHSQVVPDLTFKGNEYWLYDLTAIAEGDWVCYMSASGILRVFYRVGDDSWQRFKQKVML